jgi:hypothetical protein
LGSGRRRQLSQDRKDRCSLVRQIPIYVVIK